MANVTEVMDREIDPMGHINPDVPPMTEKQNVFRSHADADAMSANSSERIDEKKGPTYVGEMEEADMEDKEDLGVDPFVPFDDLPDERQRILTVRAMIVGCICGALVNASNVYLGLKTGWTFGASLFGAM